MDSKKHYGFIGLGNMGNSIARVLITADTTLTVFDIQFNR